MTPAKNIYNTPNAHPLERLRNKLTPLFNLAQLCDNSALPIELIKGEIITCIELLPEIKQHLTDCETYYLSPITFPLTEHWLKLIPALQRIVYRYHYAYTMKRLIDQSLVYSWVIELLAPAVQTLGANRFRFYDVIQLQINVESDKTLSIYVGYDDKALTIIIHPHMPLLMCTSIDEQGKITPGLNFFNVNYK